jgi:hypothetical protein
MRPDSHQVGPIQGNARILSFISLTPTATPALLNLLSCVALVRSSRARCACLSSRGAPLYSLPLYDTW